MGKYPYFPSVISKWVKAQTHKEISTPTSPASGYLKLYFKNDGKLYKLNSSGVESTTGADDLSAYATLASPTFTGVVTIPNVPNLETAVVANTAKVSLDDNSVTLAKLAHGTADKALGFDGSGNPAEITVGGGAEYSEVTTAGTFTPTTQTGNTKVTVDNRDLTAGSVDINVDGTSISNSSSGTTVKLVNPSSSLSVTTNDEGYDLSNAIYGGLNFTLSEAGDVNGIFLNPDGTKMYIVSYSTNLVYQYSLSTAWNISTASYDSVSFSVASQDSTAEGIFLNSDGTKMYILGAASNKVFQYSLSTAWDLSTASYDSVSLSYSAQVTSDVRAMTMSNDGLKLIIAKSSTDTMYQYSLGTAWDLSTASYDSISLVTSGMFTDTIKDIGISDDGTKLFQLGYRTVYELIMSTPFDISTASYNSVSYYVSFASNSRGLSFQSTGETLMLMFPSKVYQVSTVGSFSGTVKASVG
jgi:hypothetical protein